MKLVICLCLLSLINTRHLQSHFSFIKLLWSLKEYGDMSVVYAPILDCIRCIWEDAENICTRIKPICQWVSFFHIPKRASYPLDPSLMWRAVSNGKEKISLYFFYPICINIDYSIACWVILFSPFVLWEIFQLSIKNIYFCSIFKHCYMNFLLYFKYPCQTLDN